VVGRVAISRTVVECGSVHHLFDAEGVCSQRLIITQDPSLFSHCSTSRTSRLWELRNIWIMTMHPELKHALNTGVSIPEGKIWNGLQWRL
jgi:hypothetical protein